MRENDNVDEDEDEDDDEDEDEDEDKDEDEDEDNVGGTHRHQPLRYILGGDEPHPPRVPAPRATHILYERIGVTDS